ncbi:MULTISPECIES: hypothetical protein [unclassified Streptomyces]|uniref:Low molecular weight antigen MTB12-like C-terminal domain-containing protein n=1 Tax=Streptomyces sp. NBC_01393 TaxID=2903851 RepID=A0AAU3HT30_9ACTN|nr:hypothetical protein [Streptomyces sp. NBC_00151]WRZ42687.1 hypothetical protein OG915_34430 [Streptomyces sp. NBC_00151]
MVLGSDLRRGNAGGVAVAAVLVLAAALTACSDDSGGGSSASPTPSAAQSTSVPSATAPADPAAAQQEIRQNWEKFFDPAVSAKEKQAVLENGDQMAPLLQGFNGDQRGQQVKANVEKIEFTSPTEADVTYTLTLNGATALPNASGTAVEQNGTWKVSVKTLCALVQLSGNGSSSPVPGC